MRYLFLILTFSAALATQAQPLQLYHKWFGAADQPAIVFLHGGPGYNSASFEMDMAQRVADLGYQVLVYDQRGCGRSEAVKGAFTYDEAVEDLKALLEERKVNRVTLLGHSFGGTVALKFAEKYRDWVKAIVLISAPVDFPHCFRTIQSNCLAKLDEDDATTRKSFEVIQKMDTTTLEYASTNFMYAMASGLYTPTENLKTATKLKKKLAKHPLAPWTKKSSEAPVEGFFKSEHYTLGNHTELLQKLQGEFQINAIFGEDDGLFDEATIDTFSDIIGGERVYTLSLASHNVFLDDPYGFLDALGEILRKE